jgi:hypothetical protein
LPRLPLPVRVPPKVSHGMIGVGYTTQTQENKSTLRAAFHTIFSMDLQRCPTSLYKKLQINIGCMATVKTW